MKPLVYKKDVQRFMENFKDISSYDERGQKEYIVFKDNQRDGLWTLMHYPDDNTWSIHGKGAGYCDEGEITLSGKEVESFIYKNRKYVNTVLRALKTA